MTDSLRKLFNTNKLHGEKAEPIKVLISLKSVPDDSCLRSLQKIGLIVEAVEGNKLIGEIRPQLLAKLEQHDAVIDVERSVKLKPTDNAQRDG